jgi:Xaa-Pro aminopeptidase
VDALVSISPENVTYTVRYFIPSLRNHRRRIAICLVAPETPSTLIVCDKEETTAQRYCRVDEVRSYDEFTQYAVDILAETIHERGLSKSKIGLELDYIPAMDFAKLRKSVPDAEFINGDELFMRLRLVKTAEEIERLKTVGKLADKIHHDVSEMAHVGMTERQLGTFIAERLFAAGVDNIKLIIASGERSSLPNVPPTDRALEVGDIMRIDILGTLESYWCDCARTYVVGEPNDEQRDTWQSMIESQAVVLEKIKPGVHTADLYQAFLDKWESYGYTPTPFMGHGLGLQTHEGPYIGKRLTGVLEEGMVLCVEPTLRVPGWMGFQLEDEIIVTSDGYELITDQTDTSQLLKIH